MSINIGIISIGDELMNGLTIDSNSSWIARKISNYKSLVVSYKTTCKDESEHIKNKLDYLLKNNFKYIFVTGGLGPTHDDITKHTLCDYFDCKLILDKDYYNKLKKYFKGKNIPNKKHLKSQAEILDISKPIINKYGTALGMIIELNNTIIFIMPGVPKEMQGMMNNYILPKCFNKKYNKSINNLTILTTGIYESKLYDLLKNILDENSNEFKISFLPSYKGVKLRLSHIDNSTNKNDLLSFKEIVLNKIDKYVYGFDNDTLEEIVSKILIKKHLSISIAESCTGGYLSKLLTDIPGSSNYFKGSVIAYSNKIKKDVLNIDNSTLKEYGAVSEEVALKMAGSIKNIFNTDIGISTTGISGPSGGTNQKPVGLIYISIVSDKYKIVKKFNLIQNRTAHRAIAVSVALNMLRLALMKNN